MLQSKTGETIESILAEYRGRQGVMLHIFHRMQEAFGYIPEEAMKPMAEMLKTHPSQLFGSLTFYSELRTAPPPRVQVNQCLGPTCHLKGAEIVHDIIETRLGSPTWEGDRADHGVHEVECAGHCHLAPLVYLDDEPRTVTIADAAAFADEVKGRAHQGSH